MKEKTADSKILFRHDDTTPIGRLSHSARLHKADRSDFKSMRVLGSYAIIYLLAGSGFYRDTTGFKKELGAGDLIFILPEIGHHYGPRRGEEWNEIFVVFDGPVFDLWREKGIFPTARPISHLAPIAEWLPRLESTLPISDGGAVQDAASRHLLSVTAFLGLLTEMFVPQLAASNVPAEEKWLIVARRRLEENLSAPIDMRQVAREAGLSYESFRKRFAKETGLAPARYRTQRRIAAAQTLLTQSNLTLRAIATNLGFSDEFHFSRRFKEITGTTPRNYRLCKNADNF